VHDTNARLNKYSLDFTWQVLSMLWQAPHSCAAFINTWCQKLDEKTGLCGSAGDEVQALNLMHACIMWWH
jgi:hypothetical protein